MSIFSKDVLNRTQWRASDAPKITRMRVEKLSLSDTSHPSSVQTLRKFAEFRVFIQMFWIGPTGLTVPVCMQGSPRLKHLVSVSTTIPADCPFFFQPGNVLHVYMYVKSRLP